MLPQMKTQMKTLILIIMTLLFLLLSGCDIENLARLINISEKKAVKPCLVGVWPAIHLSSEQYKMSKPRAFRFIMDVQAAVGYYHNYRRIGANKKKIPSTCEELLWHNNKSVDKSYRTCMVTWGQNTLNAHKNICSESGAYVVGATISGKKARILIVDLDYPNKFANKQERYVGGKDLNRLAKNIGKAIRKELR